MSVNNHVYCPTLGSTLAIAVSASLSPGEAHEQPRDDHANRVVEA
jgi:hypothetical protein